MDFILLLNAIIYNYFRYRERFSRAMLSGAFLTLIIKIITLLCFSFRLPPQINLFLLLFIIIIAWKEIRIYYYINNKIGNIVYYLFKEVYLFIDECFTFSDVPPNHSLKLNTGTTMAKFIFMLLFRLRFFAFREPILFLCLHLLIIYYFLHDLHIFFTYIYSFTNDNIKIFIFFK